MLRINLQLFASKKGVGSSKNGRDSRAQRLGVKTGVAAGKVTAKVLSHGKGKKIIVFKYKAKKDYRNKKGHRQPFTELEIQSIQA